MVKIGRQTAVPAMRGQAELRRTERRGESAAERVRKLGPVAQFAEMDMPVMCGRVPEIINQTTLTVVFPRVEALRELGLDLDKIYGQGNWRQCDHGGIVLKGRVDQDKIWGRLETAVNRATGLRIRRSVAIIDFMDRERSGFCESEVYLVIKEDRRRVPNPAADDD